MNEIFSPAAVTGICNTCNCCCFRARHLWKHRGGTDILFSKLSDLNNKNIFVMNKIFSPAAVTGICNTCNCCCFRARHLWKHQGGTDILFSKLSDLNNKNIFVMNKIFSPAAVTGICNTCNCCCFRARYLWKHRGGTDILFSKLSDLNNQNTFVMNKILSPAAVTGIYNTCNCCCFRAGHLWKHRGGTDILFSKCYCSNWQKSKFW